MFSVSVYLNAALPVPANLVVLRENERQPDRPVSMPAGLLLLELGEQLPQLYQIRLPVVQVMSEGESEQQQGHRVTQLEGAQPYVSFRTKPTIVKP